MEPEFVSDALADEAIAWFVRLKADDVTRQNRIDFSHWLGQNTSCQAAFLEILSLWDKTEVIKTMAELEFMSETSGFREELSSITG